MITIYIIELCLALINVFFSPAIGAVIPSITEKEDLADANGLNSLLDSIANICAPILAGLLFGTFGLLPLLVMNSLSFILSAVSEMFIQLPIQQKKESAMNVKGFLHDFKEGIAYSFHTREIVALIVSAFMANFAIAPLFSVSIPIVMKNILYVSDYEYGILSTLLASGMLLGPIIAPIILKKWDYKKVIYSSFGVGSILVVFMALLLLPKGIMLTSYYVPLLLIVLLGVIIIALILTLNIAISTQFQKTVPLDMFGRVGAVVGSLMTISAPAGQLIVGWLHDFALPSIILGIISVVLMLCSIAYYMLIRQMLKGAVEEGSTPQVQGNQ